MPPIPPAPGMPAACVLCRWFRDGAFCGGPPRPADPAPPGPDPDEGPALTIAPLCVVAAVESEYASGPAREAAMASAAVAHCMPLRAFREVTTTSTAASRESARIAHRSHGTKVGVRPR